jgi:hypothetical protein
MDFNDFKTAGITDIYVLVNDDDYRGSVKLKQKQRPIVWDKDPCMGASWIQSHFTGCFDENRSSVGCGNLRYACIYFKIKAMRSASQGVTFSLCVKPDGWDDNQYYYLIAPLCDHIVPMLYIGDYGQDITGLKEWVKFYNIYNIIYPGKIIAGLETYQSDQNITPKDESTHIGRNQSCATIHKGVV